MAWDKPVNSAVTSSSILASTDVSLDWRLRFGLQKNTDDVDFSGALIGRCGMW